MTQMDVPADRKQIHRCREQIRVCQGQRQCNGAKRVFSTSDPGTTGHPHAFFGCACGDDDNGIYKN